MFSIKFAWLTQLLCNLGSLFGGQWLNKFVIFFLIRHRDENNSGQRVDRHVYTQIYQSNEKGKFNRVTGFHNSPANDIYFVL